MRRKAIAVRELIQLFERLGVVGDRIEFVERVGWGKYIQTYQRIDIALDPFPYGGGITTCDALWMGVPVITLRGKTAVGRGGTTILSNLGLGQFIARSQEQYIAAATELAGDLARLSEMRTMLRQRMLDSPLMDATRFARRGRGVFEDVEGMDERIQRLNRWANYPGSPIHKTGMVLIDC